MRSKLNTAITALVMTTLTISLIINPQASLEASIRGLDIWWEVVFPSLLPFFIVSELLIQLGVVNFIGVLLEPLMRPLFRVPGIGGFVWAMGMASGFPSGAKLSVRLRQEKQLTQIEAERLVSFTNSSSPLFIFGAVSVGFFHNPGLGVILAASHYISNFIVGLLMRFHGRRERTNNKNTKQPPFYINKAFETLHRTRLNERRPIGKLIGDAISSSIQTLLMIGGFIILFSVLNKMLEITHVTIIASSIIQYFLSFLQLPDTFGTAILSGLFELTLGNQLTSQTEATLLQQTMVASFILAFSGLSVHAQVASILAETDIRFQPFFFARIIQCILAPLITFLLWGYLYKGNQSNSNEISVFAHSSTHGVFFLHTFGPIFTLFFLYMYIFLLWRHTREK